MTDTLALAGQRVAVIGGSSGIGFAVVQRALAEGAEVVIGSSGPEKVKAAVARSGGASGRVADVTDEASLAAFFAATGRIDHLVFTAGDWGASHASGPLSQLDIAAARDGTNVRFWGALATIKHSLPHLSEAGSITLTDGLLARRPRKGAALASAFTGAIEHLVTALALDLAPIRVNSVCPGLTLTEAMSQFPAEMIDQMTAAQPVPRAGKAEELAQPYLYLMKSTYTTGQVIVVDGGASIA